MNKWIVKHSKLTLILGFLCILAINIALVMFVRIWISWAIVLGIAIWSLMLRYVQTIMYSDAKIKLQENNPNDVREAEYGLQNINDNFESNKNSFNTDLHKDNLEFKNNAPNYENTYKNDYNQSKLNKYNGFCLAGFVLGLSSIFLFVMEPYIPILAIILSSIGLKGLKIREQRGKNLAIWGLVLGILFTLVAIVFWVFISKLLPDIVST